jgi:uncharacterized membrane protein YidH (DUF202 family)
MAEPEESQQIKMMRQMVGLAEQQVTLSEQRSEMSEQRSEMSEFRSFLNGERTLSVWVRTALAEMIAGLAIDRFGLLFHGNPGPAQVASSTGALLDAASAWTSIGLIVLGIVTVLTTGIRFLRYALDWRGRHTLPPHHGPYLAPFLALMAGVFGIVLLIIMIAAPR